MVIKYSPDQEEQKGIRLICNKFRLGIPNKIPNCSTGESLEEATSICSRISFLDIFKDSQESVRFKYLILPQCRSLRRDHHLWSLVAIHFYYFHKHLLK